MQLLVSCVQVHECMCERLCMCVFAAHALRDGHHQGSGTSERGRSVKDLKPCSPTEEADRLWCWCEQIKGSQNEWNGPLSAVERPSHGPQPAACLLCFQSGGVREGALRKMERGKERSECVWGEDTHRKTGREGVGGPESYWFHSRAKSKYCSVLYLPVCAASYKGHLYIYYPV